MAILHRSVQSMILSCVSQHVAGLVTFYLHYIDCSATLADHYRQNTKTDALHEIFIDRMIGLDDGSNNSEY